MPRTLLTAALAALTLIAASPARSVACPGVTVLTGESAPSTPAFTVVRSTDTTFTVHGCDNAHMLYKEDQRLVLAEAGSCATSSPTTGVEVIGEDELAITGAPAGTPVTFTIDCLFSGEAHPGAPAGGGSLVTVRGLVREGAANQSSATISADDSAHPHGGGQVLTLLVHGTVGTPVHVVYQARVEATLGFGYAEAWLTNVAMPPGFGLQSCHGWVYNPATPVKSTTWGRLKSSYR